MAGSEPTRREVLKLLAGAPLVAGRRLSAVQVAPAPGDKRTRLCLVSRHLQWTNMEEAVAVAAEAGCKAISWTVRAGAHILPTNVERDLPKAVDLARKAGLDAPMFDHSTQRGHVGACRSHSRHDARRWHSLLSRRAVSVRLFR